MVELPHSPQSERTAPSTPQEGRRRDLHREAVRALVEVAPALGAAVTLERLNSEGRAIGETARLRLLEAVAVLREVVDEDEDHEAADRRIAVAAGDARVAAAAVLVAVEVHRRRAARQP
ncbi:MAG: hypothetical protein AMXMBFR23_04980 [Chloroflexota bacterium]